MTLSSRAKAFFVDNLLNSPSHPSLHTNAVDKDAEYNDLREDSDDVQEKVTSQRICRAPNARRLHSDCGLVNDSATVPSTTSNVEYCPDIVESCFCHGEMSLCIHPGIINVRGQNKTGQRIITVELLHSNLWLSFHRLGTEMIITKSGRRMFPSFKLRIKGLDPLKKYATRLEFLQPDSKKYRYIYHRWMISGSGDALLSTACHMAPESPQCGQSICSQVLSFERLKLTNCENCKSGQVSLISMQKFQPRVVVEEVKENDQGWDGATECYHILFPQTSFMAVTAYQNQQITTLKIASNPFAKGFRDSGKLRYSHDDCLANQLGSPHQTGPTRIAYSARFHPYSSPAVLPSVEGRQGSKRHYSSLWQAETSDNHSKFKTIESPHSFTTSPSLPFFLQPHLPFSPYIPVQTTSITSAMQRLFSHDTSPFSPVLTSRKGLMTPTQMSSSTSVSPSSSSSSLFLSPLMLNRVSPMPLDEGESKPQHLNNTNTMAIYFCPALKDSTSPEMHTTVTHGNFETTKEPEFDRKTDPKAQMEKGDNTNDIRKGGNPKKSYYLAYQDEVISHNLSINTPKNGLKVSGGQHKDNVTLESVSTQNKFKNCVICNSLHPTLLNNVTRAGAPNLTTNSHNINLRRYPLGVHKYFQSGHFLNYQYQ